MSADEATNPATWARQIRATVRFSDELDVLLADPCRVLVEVGPGGTSDRLRDASPEVVKRAPRRSAHAPPSAEPKRSRHLPARARATVVSGYRRRLGTPVGRSPAATRFASRLSLCAPTALGRAQQRPTSGRRCRRDERGGGRVDITVAGRCPCGHKRQVADGSDVAAHLGAVSRVSDSIDRNANFFELGGDSLIAISVAMTRGQRRSGPHAAGPVREPDRGSARQGSRLPDTRRAVWRGCRPMTWSNPPVPPNIAYFLEQGLREAGRWRIPLILQLRPDVERGGRPVGADRRDQPSRCAAAADRAAGGNMGAARRRTAGVHRTGDAVASRRCSRRKPAGTGRGVGHPRRAYSRAGAVEPAVDRHVYPWPAGRTVLSRRSACMRSWPTTRRATSCSPTSSPRSRNAWQAKILRCNRSPQLGGVVAAVCRARHASGGARKPRLLAENRDQSHPATGQIGGHASHRGPTT